jgi:hypothetical protein
MDQASLASNSWEGCGNEANGEKYGQAYPLTEVRARVGYIKGVYHTGEDTQDHASMVCGVAPDGVRGSHLTEGSGGLPTQAMS